MRERIGSVYVRPAGVGAAAAAFEACLRERFGGPAHTVSADGPPSLIAEAAALGLPVAFHSSGTTGRTTCAVFDPETRARHSSAVLASLDLSEDVTWCALPPPGYAYGVSIVETHAEAGIDVRFIRGASIPQRLNALAEPSAGGSARPIAVYLTPQLLPILLSAGLGPQSVRRVVVAGGRLSAGAARVLAARFRGVQLTNMYGQAELGPRISRWHGPADEFVEGDVGLPLDGVTVTIAASHEGLAGRGGATEHKQGPAVPPPGDPGRILVRSQFAAALVIRDPDLGPEALPQPLDTGDLGWFDSAGHVRHAGRGDHVLNVAGTRVGVDAIRRSIEESLAPIGVRISQRPAAVIGDVIPVVEVVGAPGTTLRGRDVRRALHATIGSLAALCDVRIVDQLTVGESGK